jgi:hypothetical protein
LFLFSFTFVEHFLLVFMGFISILHELLLENDLIVVLLAYSRFFDLVEGVIHDSVEGVPCYPFRGQLC